jgi:nitrogen fixation-related uncharacterized protein
MMTAVIALVVLAVFVLVDVLVLLYGADSRTYDDWA